MKVSTSVYLVLEPEHNYKGETTGLRLDRALATLPRSISAKHVALKVNVELDSAIFEQFIPEATLRVTDGRVLITPGLSVEEPTDADVDGGLLSGSLA